MPKYYLSTKTLMLKFILDFIGFIFQIMKKFIYGLLGADHEEDVKKKHDQAKVEKNSSSSSSKVSTQSTSSTPAPPPPPVQGSLSKSKQKKNQRKNKQNQKQQQKQPPTESQANKPQKLEAQAKQNEQTNDNSENLPNKQKEPKELKEPEEPKEPKEPNIIEKEAQELEKNTKTALSSTNQTKKTSNTSENRKPNEMSKTPEKYRKDIKKNQKLNQNVPETSKLKDPKPQETDLEYIDGASQIDKTKEIKKSDENHGKVLKPKRKTKKQKEERLIEFSDREDDDSEEENKEEEGVEEEQDNNEKIEESDHEDYETSSVSSLDMDGLDSVEEESYVSTSEVESESETNTTSTSSLPTYNILLLGETGAGKSTTINAFANYLRYASFDDAIKSKFVQLIPSKFTLPNPETGEPFVIQSGADDNEFQGNDGNSNTQSPMGYTFRTRDRMIRIIDTPGMGDTRGVEIDKKNFDKILGYLNYHKELHGICILIKSNETRKTASFRYCISELLTHLHKSACKNIVFCFTFGRNSFYGPGEGYAILRGFLKNELKEANLELKTGVNCFFIDNEAYRFLVAKKQGYPFPDYHENLYRESWNKSVRQTQTMIGKFIGLEPHNLRQTTSLNHSRKLIMELAEPMVQLQKMVHQNIEKIKVYDKKLKQSSKSKSEMLPNLSLEVDELVMKPLAKPKTVCTGARCTDVMEVNGQQEILYKTVCHDECYVEISGVKSNTVGHAMLEGCAVINKTTKLCEKCGCQWQKHMHLSFEYVRVRRTIVDENLQRQIFNEDNCITDSQKALEVLRKVVKEFSGELKVIRKVAAQFGYMLNQNSNTSFNKFIEPYIDKLIQEERKMISSVKGYPQTNLDLLESIRKQHERDVLELIQAIFNDTHQIVQLEDIPRLRSELFRLKHTGPQFRQMLHCTGVSEEQTFAFQDRVGLNFSAKVEDEQEEDEVIDLD